MPKVRATRGTGGRRERDQHAMLVRLDRRLVDALRTLALQERRSMRAQIETLVETAVREAGLLKDAA